ncbi:hypothetical protein I3760_08G111100 [Carya illinoinensis]|nr:hypothetical protein I3760_08G111100 [Carya illinoinensis]
MDDQITKVKEQALSRNDIMDKVEKWRYATKEEKWLEEYERVEKLGKDSLTNCAKTSMSLKLIAGDSDFFANLVYFYVGKWCSYFVPRIWILVTLW